MINKNINKYVNELLKDLDISDDLLGVLIYGSYVLNLEDEFSDIDVLIIVEERSKNICGRGNKYINNIPIEYFITAESAIYEELLNELETLEPSMQIELLSGVILIDKYNTILKLKNRAKKVSQMPYKPLSDIEIEGITITLRNQFNEIKRKYKHKEKDFSFCYYNYLYELIKVYCDYNMIPIRKYKFYKTYTDKEYRTANMQLDINDEYIKKEFIYLIEQINFDRISVLTEYILNKISSLPKEYRIHRNKEE